MLAALNAVVVAPVTPAVIVEAITFTPDTPIAVLSSMSNDMFVAAVVYESTLNAVFPVFSLGPGNPPTTGFDMTHVYVPGFNPEYPE